MLEIEGLDRVAGSPDLVPRRELADLEWKCEAVRAERLGPPQDALGAAWPPEAKRVDSALK
jgi:hypothetical protein